MLKHELDLQKKNAIFLKHTSFWVSGKAPPKICRLHHALKSRTRNTSNAGLGMNCYEEFSILPIETSKSH